VAPPVQGIPRGRRSHLINRRGRSTFPANLRRPRSKLCGDDPCRPHNSTRAVGLCTESFDTYISGASFGDNNSGVAAVLEKFLTWDIWVAVAIAVGAVLIILIFDLQPLLIVVIFLALGGYIAAYTMIDGRNEF
jgi:hypothetical protein